MPVRDARPDDLDEIVAMIHELAAFEESADEVEVDPDQLAEHLWGEPPAVRALVAEPAGSPGTVAGMALWFPTYSTWVGQPGIWLEDLFVRPDHRRLGLAGELLGTLGDRTPGRVEWSVLDWNRGAIDFYDRLGASPVPGWTRYRWAPGRSPGQAGRPGPQPDAG